MIQKIQVYYTDCVDPHRNLATEKYLLEHVAPDSCILYLWQNKNTVVIGRNQNAWSECRTCLLAQEGGQLARRLSGGGAVYHDLGNQNFTFLVSDENYDLDRQLSVIQNACLALGIQAERSGRNDILVDGRKFSGNAFYHSQGNAYHHGTIMVDVDMEKLPRYLNPPKAKLESKGVASVRSRVVNLKQYCPDLTCEMMRQKLQDAFAHVYGLTPEVITLDDDALSSIEKDMLENKSWQWLYGNKLSFSVAFDAYFSWGYIQLQMQVHAGVVTLAKVYSDAMDWSIAPALEQVLTGAVFSQEKMQTCVSACKIDAQIADDVCNLLAKQEF